MMVELINTRITNATVRAPRRPIEVTCLKLNVKTNQFDHIYFDLKCND